MPTIGDFRSASKFDLRHVDSAGKNVGREVYWKLYSIENVVRVIIHSVLSVQITPGPWWDIAVSPGLQRKAANFRTRYSNRPWHSSPGNHGIYYLDLVDLNEIVRPNSHLFLPVIPDIHQWMAKLEQIKLPRNVVAHMNWPNPTDRMRIEVLYRDVHELARTVARVATLTAP
jgi:hypothetical protein